MRVGFALRSAEIKPTFQRFVKIISPNFHLRYGLTEKEIEIILFLNSQNKSKNIQDLQKEVWGYISDLETHTVETHIYRLRKKIKENFNDENFIISSKAGYHLNE